ncbi:mRNA triphosphatase CET1 [Karstenula rhodostoma CBS 690.94]|uniref:mRNA-capping enzyme subunit beta n=1 Tax=Karstenula rhodostoma CBS 690.94 TaxID=1392251 RepID=A0A9P4U7X0_9PLEO|nr:mRNA triphosphatase CET1 [Karstenula rhodostoma CBS 690.94]
MDIAALVNPVSESLPRRSPSGSHNIILASSPALENATLPTTPRQSHTSVMSRKRKRHDPKPIWAVREDEIFDGKTLQQDINERQRQQTPKSHPQVQAQAQAQPRPQPSPSQPPPVASRNGHAQIQTPSQPSSAPQPTTSAALAGFERPISHDPRVYDEIQRKVCDFLFTNIVVNDRIRVLLQEAPDTTVEVEARWGHIVWREQNERLTGVHSTECVLHSTVSQRTKFDSVMNLQQHQQMNKYLNKQVFQAKPGNPTNRPEIGYKHTRLVDQQFELGDEALSRLSPAAQSIIRASGKQERIRVSRDQKTGEVVAAIIKHKVNNLEISSPQTEWDYRIGINIEIVFPGSLDGLTEVVEKGKGVEAMKRYKDRMSYSYKDAYQIDLTQVTQDGQRIHELELELESSVLLEHGDRVRNQQPNEYESLINGMINNLRVLSREVTPPKR